MKISLMKEQFLHFFAALITGTLFGYLSHDLINGVRTGIIVGIVFFIGGFRKNREKRKQE